MFSKKNIPNSKHLQMVDDSPYGQYLIFLHFGEIHFYWVITALRIVLMQLPCSKKLFKNVLLSL